MTAARALARATALLPLGRARPAEHRHRCDAARGRRSCGRVGGRFGVQHRAAGSPSGEQLPAWWPGAHLDVHLPSGRMRTYSLCGDFRDRSQYRIAVRRLADGGGGSVEAHEVLQVGSRITARGPRNAFPFAPPGCRLDRPARPLRRRWHRHHADPGDDQPGAGTGHRLVARLLGSRPAIAAVPRRARPLRRSGDRAHRRSSTACPPPTIFWPAWSRATPSIAADPPR